MKKRLLLSLLVAGCSATAMAQNIDPSDLTNVYTQAAFLVGGDSTLKPVTMVSGGYDNGHKFAFLGEATFGAKGEDADNKFGLNYRDSRAQYFHVLDANNRFIPSFGVSLDYIHQKTDSVTTNLAAVGTVVGVNPLYTPGFMVFPIAAYVDGDIKISDHKAQVDGVSLALAATHQIGDTGAFILLWPEYQKLTGYGLTLTKASAKLSLNAPITTSRKLWVNTRLDYGQSEMKANDLAAIKSDDSQVYMGLRYFF
ncbi:hypothetical protein G5S52_12310 [Grimontia sp. S25]|uniref:Porin n=1 Tax=Grimontia sedimenti TaxID=2711294 RepID=A0A6M1R8F2_9GAMM|nr:hypothetical protein [Grimontia sedimenti]NGN98403.1 hypothetical protein [Grimontia sedimenti]